MGKCRLYSYEDHVHHLCVWDDKHREIQTLLMEQDIERAFDDENYIIPEIDLTICEYHQRLALLLLAKLGVNE